MNQNWMFLRFAILLLGIVWSGAVAMAAGKPSFSASVAGRQHAENSEVTELPYGDGDLSVMLGLEAGEGLAYWQLAVDLATEADLNSDVSLIATPQLNLFMADRVFIGGVGILDTFLQDDAQGDEWTDVYYQYMMGLDFPLGKKMKVTAMAHHLFDDFGRSYKVDFNELDYSVGVSYRF